MDLLQKNKQDNAGEITALIVGSWRLFNENIEQCEGRAKDIFGVKTVPIVPAVQSLTAVQRSTKDKLGRRFHVVI
jgi:hypothetical protein